MAKGPAVKVEGAREVRKALKAVDGGTRNMTNVHRAVAQSVVPAAVGRTRRGRTGALASSYKVRASAAKAAITSALVYAPIQEFGWPRRGIRESLALSGAVESERGAIVDQYTRAVADVVERAQEGRS